MHDLGAGGAKELAQGLVLIGGDRGVGFGQPSELAPSREADGIGNPDEHAAKRRNERLAPEGPFVRDRHGLRLHLVRRAAIMAPSGRGPSFGGVG